MELHIWQARNDKKVSLRKLSKMTGISKTALNNYETGKRFPTIRQLEKIAIALDTNISKLYESEYK